MKNKIEKVIPVYYYALFALFLICITSFLLPAGDDWAYSSPIFKFEWDLLMPEKTFWRPIDRCWALFLGRVPTLFPLLNHVEIVFMHIISLFVLERIAVKLRLEKKIIWIVCVYAAISPSAMATLFSVDSLNQSTSLAFGLMGLLGYISSTKKRKYMVWIICSIISVLSKESGIVYFVLVPLFNEIIYREQWKSKNKEHINHFLLSVVVGIIFVLVYFAIRFALLGSLTLGEDEGRYQVSIFSMAPISNAILLFSICFSVVDTLSLFIKQSYSVWLLITILSSVYIFCFLVHRFCKKIKDKECYWEVMILIICILIITSPQIVIGRSGEMHAYPTLFMVSLFIGFLCNGIKWNKWSIFPCILFVVVSFSVDVHKYISIYQYGKLGETTSMDFYKATDETPQRVLFISVDEDDAKGYSVFCKPAAVACGQGRGVKPLYNYKYPLVLDFVKCKNSEERTLKIDRLIGMNPDQYNYIWTVIDNRAIVYKLE